MTDSSDVRDRRRHHGSPPVVAAGARPGALVCAAVLLGGCGSGVLNPQGREAARVATVWWVMFALATVIFVGVLVVLVVGLRRPGTTQDDPDAEIDEHEDVRAASLSRPARHLIVGGGIILPSIVIVVLMALTLWSGADVRRESSPGAMRIDVVGHQYWWDVRYPELDVRTANEIHLPVGVEVLLSLESDDVIHSIWIPQIGGKLDLIPGRVNRMTVRADAAGTYEGMCAEFCGLQHANMRLVVIAHEPDDFDDWAERAYPEHPTPTDPVLFEGWETFMSSSCVYCHAINGSPALSEFGPDLTNLAQRERLAAGIIPNNRGELAGWILDPQSSKPGNHMPASWIEPERLDALLDYLETLG